MSLSLLLADEIKGRKTNPCCEHCTYLFIPLFFLLANVHALHINKGLRSLVNSFWPVCMHNMLSLVKRGLLSLFFALILPCLANDHTVVLADENRSWNWIWNSDRSRRVDRYK